MLLLVRVRRGPLLRNQFSLLQLPASCRSFHASPRPQFLEVSISAVHTLFDGIHGATGLPWAYTIPLTAFAVRTAFVLPLSIYTRLNLKEQIALFPLLAAWQHPLRKRTIAEVGHLGPVIAHGKLLEMTMAKRRELYKRWGCSLWKNYLPLAQMPIWLVAIETVREMCGAGQGLLMDSFGDVSKPLTAVPSEPSLASEGMLWFPDLIASDPHLALPFILSGVMLLNIGKAKGVQTVGQKRFTNVLRGVALAIGPVMLQMPSAMLLYWISSAGFGYMQALILDRVMPIQPTVLPCKRKDGGSADPLEVGKR